jgi:hypothetical protein
VWQGEVAELLACLFCGGTKQKALIDFVAEINQLAAFEKGEYSWRRLRVLELPRASPSLVKGGIG